MHTRRRDHGQLKFALEVYAARSGCLYGATNFSAAEDEAMIEEVVVTGSYIARAVEERTLSTYTIGQSGKSKEARKWWRLFVILQQCRER